MEVKDLIRVLNEKETNLYNELNRNDKEQNELFDELDKARKKKSNNFESIQKQIYDKIDVLMEESIQIREQLGKIRKKKIKLREILDDESMVEGVKVDLYKTLLDDGYCYDYKICLHGTKTVVGHVHYMGEIDKLYIGYEGNIGYGVDDEHRGKGYASEALSLLLDKLSKDGIKQAYIAVARYNVASHKVAQKVGGKLVEEFSLPEQSLYKCDLNIRLNKNNKR